MSAGPDSQPAPIELARTQVPNVDHGIPLGDDFSVLPYDNAILPLTEMNLRALTAQQQNFFRVPIVPPTDGASNSALSCHMRDILYNQVALQHNDISISESHEIDSSDPESRHESDSRPSITVPMVSAQRQVSFDLVEPGHFYKYIAESTKCTAFFVFFQGPSSPLSTYYRNELREESFSGANAFDLMMSILPSLAALCYDGQIIDMPNQLESLSVQAVRQHFFTCGNQFIMAMKAAFFERGEVFSSLGMSTGQVSSILAGLKRRYCPKDISRSLYKSPLFNILRSLDPKRQTAQGRRVKNFDIKQWRTLADSAMVAMIIMRCMHCAILKELVVESGTRTFVEASPSDSYWGIKTGLNSDRVYHEVTWKGENRLGWCYSRAREYLRGHTFTNG